MLRWLRLLCNSELATDANDCATKQYGFLDEKRQLLPFSWLSEIKAS